MARKWTIGIDEAGRGPLAGPVTVAAVATKYPVSSIKYQVFFRKIRDSKKLTPKQREEWFKKIKSNPRFFIAHSSVGHKAIDKNGISKAARRAVRNCLKKIFLDSSFKILNSKILLDGSLYAPSEFINQKTIIKGDERVPIIAAASIVAKVTRDRKMTRFAKKFPKYFFEIHKGYGTERHLRAILKHGLCDIHRRSFCKKFNPS